MGKVEKTPVDVRYICKYNAEIITKLKDADWNERLPSGCLTDHENNVAYITDFKSFEGNLDYRFDDYSGFFRLKTAAYKEWKEVEFIPYNTKYGVNPEKIIEVLRILHGGYKAKIMGEAVLGFTPATWKSAKPIILFIPYKDDYAVFIVAPLMGSDGANLELESVTIDETISFVEPVRVPFYYDLKTQTIGYSYNDEIVSVGGFKEEWGRKHLEYKKQLGKAPELTRYFFGGFGAKIVTIGGFLSLIKESKGTEGDREGIRKSFAWVKRKYEQIPFSDLQKSPYYDAFKPLFDINEILPELAKNIDLALTEGGNYCDTAIGQLNKIHELGKEHTKTTEKYYKELTGQNLRDADIESRALMEYRSKEQIQDQVSWLKEQDIKPNSFEKAAMEYYGVVIPEEEPPWRRLLDVIKDLEKEHGLEVPEDKAIATATEVGIEKREDLIYELKRDGILYSPAKGLIARVEKEEKIQEETIEEEMTLDEITLKRVKEKILSYIYSEEQRENTCDFDIETFMKLVTAHTTFTSAFFRRAIDELKAEGVLYSPREGVIRRTECEEKEVPEEIPPTREEVYKNLEGVFTRICLQRGAKSEDLIAYIKDYENRLAELAERVLKGEITKEEAEEIINDDVPPIWIFSKHIEEMREKAMKLKGEEEKPPKTPEVKVEEEEQEVKELQDKVTELKRSVREVELTQGEYRRTENEIKSFEEELKNRNDEIKRVEAKIQREQAGVDVRFTEREKYIVENLKRYKQLQKEYAALLHEVEDLYERLKNKYVEAFYDEPDRVIAEFLGITVADVKERKRYLKIADALVPKIPAILPPPEKVRIHGVLKTRYRCPICYRAAPDNFCMVHSDVEAIDLLATDEPVKEAVIDLTFLDLFKTKHPEKKRWAIDELHDAIGVDIDYAPEFLAKPRIPETYAQYYARELGVEIEEITPPVEVKPPVEERTETQETVFEYFKKEIDETSVDAYQRGYLDVIHREIGREFTVDHLLLSDSEELYQLMDLQREKLEAELRKMVVPVPPEIEKLVETEKLEILRKARKYKRVEAEVPELKIGAKVKMNDKEGFLVDVSANKYRVNWDDGTWDWIMKKDSESVIVY